MRSFAARSLSSLRIGSNLFSITIPPAQLAGFVLLALRPCYGILPNGYCGARVTRGAAASTDLLRLCCLSRTIS
jgi:hypothetical protein